VLDEVDFKILAELSKDGRTSLVKLAHETGLSHPSVRMRLSKLIKSNLVKVQANLNPRLLGLAMAIACIEVEGAEGALSLIEFLEGCPRAVFAALVMGEYNVVALLVAESLEALSSMVERRLRPRGVKKINLNYVNLVRPPHLPIKVAEPRQPPCSTSCESCELKKLNLCSGCPSLMLKQTVAAPNKR